jgi:3-dehydroquinate dehydratase / shikimate dehydrogenase
VICVTGAERSAQELAQRLEAHEADGVMQEARLDLLHSINDAVFDLLARTPRLIVTCRCRTEGGGFMGTEVERAGIMRRALAGRPDYMDLELSAPAELRGKLFGVRGETRLICSLHRLEPGPPAPEVMAELAAAPADLLKVCLTVEDAVELEPLRGLLQGESRPVIRLGMGDAGQASRVLYRRFRSPWTYVVPDGAPAVAPGQLTVGEARAMRLEDQDLTPLGLLGGPQVMHSPGTPVYNRIFSRRGLPYRYLPVVTRRPLEALSLLQLLDFKGLTVTMPAKELFMGEVTGWLRPDDKRVGALNTLSFFQQGWYGANTDQDALTHLLVPWRGASALVLGAGGAARAALAALAKLGCPATVCGRKTGRTELLAQKYGATAASWEARGDVPFKVLINTTPVGADGDGDPLPAGVDLTDAVVVDAVLRPSSTPLVHRAVAAGAERVFDGPSWWVLQGSAQMMVLLGESVSSDELAHELDACWRVR